MRDHLGLREITALAVLGVALVIGFVFLDPGAGGSNPAQRPTPLPATIEPAAGLGPWTLTYLDAATPAPGVIAQSTRQAATLELDFPGAPFGEVHDDAWSVSASAEFAGNPGSYRIDIRFSGSITLSIGGRDVPISPATGEGRAIVPFEAATDPVRITIHMVDSGGPLRLAATVIAG